MPAAPAIEQIAHAIHLIRGRKVMLDTDLAAIYESAYGRNRKNS